ncbi:hypothetical protein Vafri_3048 [Volvox africanus]|uniref:Protein kinase domain-containing protein n=1 Tax=Volvox africanus TaxID=51714 RepID=A0A8J4EVY9_9CHLO|nr:hypothetical protein Vafri_3048 [Volvox africanus]
MRREHPGWTDDVTAAGQLAVVQYKPFQHAEIRLLQTLSRALPWSEAIATALREALAHGGFQHRSTLSTANDRGNVQRKVHGGNRRKAMLSESRDGEGCSGSSSDSRGGGGGGGGGVKAQNGSGSSEPALAVHAIQLALATLGGVPGHLAGGAEGRCAAAAFALSVAMATTVEGHLPPQLLRVVSPHRASLEQLRPLGKGGFGSVVAVRSRLDHRVMALKTVAFRSKLPPWAPFEQLEREHAKLLREVQTLASLDGSPHVVRYYNAWIEPAWEKLGHELQGSGREREARQPQARPAGKGKTKAAPPSATTGYRPPEAAMAAPSQGANLGAARAGGMAESPSQVRPSNRVRPRMARVEANFNGGTGLQPCRIRELRGSRSSSSNSSPSGNSAESDENTDTKSDGDRVRDFGVRSLGHDRLHHRFQYRVASATTPQRPVPRIEPLVDLPISPEITSSPFPAWAVSGADAIADALVAPRQPIVTLPSSSSEPSRRRSLDSVGASSRRSTSSGYDDGSAISDAAAAAHLLVTVPGKSEDESSLGRGWVIPRSTGGRSPTPHPWSSQPLITSLSTSPEGPTGATLARGSLLSSSIESIRVPPGGRIAVSLAGGISGCGGRDDAPVVTGGPFGNVIIPKQAVSSRGNGERGRIVRSAFVASDSNRRAWDETAMEDEQYARKFDRGHILATGTSQDDNKGDTMDTTHSSSTTATLTATVTDAAVHDGNSDVTDKYGTEEFSWTFDRGDEITEDTIAEGSLRQGPESRPTGATEMGGGGGSGGAFPCSGIERGNVQGLARYERDGSSDNEGRSGGGRGGVLERRSRKGRRGKGGHSADGIAARKKGGGCRKGDIVLLSGATGIPTFLPHLSRGSTSESNSFSGSGSGSDSDGSDSTSSGSSSSSSGSSNSNSNSSGSSNSNSNSSSSSSSGSGKCSDSEDESDSESSGTWNEYGLPGLHAGAPSPSKYNRFHKHRNYSDRDRGGAIIPPSQLPLPAPRHQRRRSVQWSGVCSTDGETKGETRRHRQRERPRRSRGHQKCFPVAEEGNYVDGTDCTARGGTLGSVPAATAWDWTVLSGIREWPYRLYISMELVRGPTLTLWLQQRTERFLNGRGSRGYRLPDHPPDPPTVERSIFRQIVMGLCYVHASGIIHRDLKPANIFLVPIEKAPVAAGAGSWDGFGAGPSVGSGSAAVAANAGAVQGDNYLVKIGDFGLAVDHELPQDLLDNTREPFSSSTSTSTTSSAAYVGGPFGGSAAAITTAAVGRGAQLHRLLSVPLLSDALLAGACSGEGVLPTAEGPGPDMPRWNSSSTSAHTSGVGTASYSAPEQLRDQSSGVSFYGPAVDIYPLGLILMELFCLHGTAMERANAMRDARQGRLPTSFLHSYPLEARLAEACLRTVPELRPSASQILELLDAMWGSQTGTETGPLAWTGGPSLAAAAENDSGDVAGGSSGSSRCSNIDAAPGQGRGPFVARGRDAIAKERQNKDLGFRLGKARCVTGCLLAEDATAAPPVAVAALRAMQRADLGPLPRNNPPLPHPLLPPRPCPPFHGPNMTESVLQPPYDEARSTFVIGSRRFSTAVAAVLEDVGTQTELTWVPEHQLMPRALGGADRLDMAYVPLQPSVHATMPEYSATVPEFVAATTDASTATVPAIRCGAAADEDDTAVLHARLQSLEAEMQRLRERLADMHVA